MSYPTVYPAAYPGDGVDITVSPGPTASRSQVAPRAGATASRAEAAGTGSVQGDGKQAGSVQGDGKQAGATTVNRQA